jgi:hypothetical protein
VLKGEGKMEEDISNRATDISNKTIVVLVILTVLISVLGTFTVLGEVGAMKAQTMKAIPKSSSSSGQVSLTIVPNEAPLPPSNSVGYITLEILPREK